MSYDKRPFDPSFAAEFISAAGNRTNEELSNLLCLPRSMIENWKSGKTSPDHCLRDIVFKALKTGVLDRISDLAVPVDRGYLVLITRMPKSRLKTTRNKRRGTRCSLRRYELVYPSLQREPLRTVERGYAFADGDLAADLRKVALSPTPFYAVVDSPNLSRRKILGLIDHDTAQAAIRMARQRAEDAEWDAAAPTKTGEHA